MSHSALNLGVPLIPTLPHLAPLQTEIDKRLLGNLDKVYWALLPHLKERQMALQAPQWGAQQVLLVGGGGLVLLL